MRCAVVSYPKSGRTWLRVMLDELGVGAKYCHAKAEAEEPQPEIAEQFDRIVFLSRDPRDTVVSHYYQITKKDKQFGGSMGEFIRDPKWTIGKIVRFNRAWLERAKEEPGKFLCLTYEELWGDTQGLLRQVCGHFGADVKDQDVRETVERNRFEEMRKRELSGEFIMKYGPRFARPSKPDYLKCRRGVIGGYVDELSAEDIAYCNEMMATA